MAELELDVSDAVASLSKRPLIKKGYYPGRLVEAKPRQKRDGTLIEAQYGHQLVLLFEVLDPKTLEPIKVTEKNTGQDSITSEVRLPMLVYYKYKDGTNYRTAVTRNAKITKAFVSLGWEFDPKKTLKVNDFIGSFCELNVDDYEVEVKDQSGTVTETYKASQIKDINIFEGEIPKKNIEGVKEVKKESVNDVVEDEITEKEKQLKEMYEKGIISKEGFNQALEQLQKAKEKK